MQSRLAAIQELLEQQEIISITKVQPDAVIIGWSTWEREEWLHDNVYWQVNAGGVGNDWPEEIKERYKKYVVNIDWNQYEQQAHTEIFFVP